jgi:transposase-like protein
LSCPKFLRRTSRWTSKRRAALVPSVLKGETSIQEAARKHGLTAAEIEEWNDRFLLAAENALRSRPKDEGALRDEQIKKLERKVGQLVLETDVLKEALKIVRPLAPGDVPGVMEALPQLSQREACTIPGVPRSAFRKKLETRGSERGVDEVLAARIHELIKEYPTFGYRRDWA